MPKVCIVSLTFDAFLMKNWEGVGSCFYNCVAGISIWVHHHPLYVEHDKNNEIHAFNIITCPSMCHVFLICLWNYDHFALCIFHGCHLSFSIQTLDGFKDAFYHPRPNFCLLNLSLLFLLLSLSLSTLFNVLWNSKEFPLKKSICYIHIFTTQTWNSL